MTKNSQATIKCDLAFKCPKAWDQLIETPQKNVRFCNECKKEVYLVDTEEERLRHAAQGHCIAIPFHESDSDNDLGEITHILGMTYSPYGDDLPEGQNPGSYARLKTFIRGPQRDRA